MDNMAFDFMFTKFLNVMVARGIIDNNDKCYIEGLMDHDTWKSIPYDEEGAVDCSECVHYGKLECLDCERTDLFEKRSEAE